MRVLIVDDDRLTRVHLRHTLGEAGHAVVVADAGESAWQVLRGYPPDVVILDAAMNGDAGLDVCRRIRREPRLEGIYVVLLVARAEPGDVTALLDAGADDYVRKPFDPAELTARLRVGERIVRLQRELAALMASSGPSSGLRRPF